MWKCATKIAKIHDLYAKKYVTVVVTLVTYLLI